MFYPFGETRSRSRPTFPTPPSTRILTVQSLIRGPDSPVEIPPRPAPLLSCCKPKPEDSTISHAPPLLPPLPPPSLPNRCTVKPKSRSSNRTKRASPAAARSVVPVPAPLGDRQPSQPAGDSVQLESEARRRLPVASSPDSQLVSAGPSLDYPILLVCFPSWFNLC
jgi:hypothetical protein